MVSLQLSEVPQALAIEFNRCWPFLEPALIKMNEGYGKDFVWAKVAHGECQLWPGQNAAVISEIEVYPDGLKVINGWLAGGDFEEIKLLTKQAEEFGRRHGCQKARAIQRMGFLRKPYDPAYKPLAVIVEKEL